jgi:hypothetical protein
MGSCVVVCFIFFPSRVCEWGVFVFTFFTSRGGLYTSFVFVGAKKRSDRKELEMKFFNLQTKKNLGCQGDKRSRFLLRCVTIGRPAKPIWINRK